MKKLLTVSLVAMMAVTTARAEIASKAYVDQQDGQLSTLKTTAKTNLVAAINELSDKAGATSVADQIAAALEDYTETGEDESYAPADVLSSLNYTSSGDGVVTGVSQTEGLVAATKAKITNTEVDDNAAIAQSKIANLTTDLAAKAAASDLTAETTARQDADTAINTKIGSGTISAKGANGTDAAADLVSAVNAIDSRLATSSSDATTTTKGIVQVGDNISVTNGVISVNDATTSQKGVMQVGSDLAVANGVVSVDKSTTVAEDDTKPVTSGAVYDAIDEEHTLWTSADSEITDYVGTIPQGSNAETVIGYVDEKAAAAATAGVANLDYAGASGDGVVTQVTQTDGVVAATKAKITNTEVADNAAIAMSKIAMPTTLGTDGVYALTGILDNGNITYKWELIQRATSGSGE